MLQYPLIGHKKYIVPKFSGHMAWDFGSDTLLGASKYGAKEGV